MVPGSTLMYGSSLMLVTRMPRDSRIAAREAAAMPFPREETTPPVTKTYLVIYLGRVGMGKFTGISVGPPILVRRHRARLGFDPHEVIVRVERRVAIEPRADLEVSRRTRRAVDEMMRVALARRIARARACPQRLLAGIGHENDLALQHIDEFVFQRVPVTQCRLAAGTERHQVDAELGQAAGFAQPLLGAVSHP